MIRRPKKPEGEPVRFNESTAVADWELKDLTKGEHLVLLDKLRDEDDNEAIVEHMLLNCFVYKGKAVTEQVLTDSLTINGAGKLLEQAVERYFPKLSSTSGT